VKQIIGGSLRDDGPGPRENYVSDRGAGWFAEKFRDDRLAGGHVIRLGAGNDEAAREAVGAWPGGLQLGGGICGENAGQWLDAGAGQVIVTSWLFDEEGTFLDSRLRELAGQIGAERLVVDLSCRRTADGWTVAMNRWQTLTTLDVTHEALDAIAPYCAEFLVHAADVEGLCQGVDEELAAHLGAWAGRPITYAGGVATMDDVRKIEQVSGGRVDVTVGSALDLFGGSGVTYGELIEWNRRGVKGGDLG